MPAGTKRASSGHRPIRRDQQPAAEKQRCFDHEAMLERLRAACAGTSFLRLARLTGINHETLRRCLRAESRPSA